MQSKHGPVYRTLDAYDAFAAWEMDDTQWILTDDTAYLVGYAPAIFGMGPTAQGWRITCPEELMALAAPNNHWGLRAPQGDEPCGTKTS